MTEIVTVRAIAAGGDGVANLSDGMVVFIPRTAIGDRVRLADIVRKGRLARAEVAELLESSPDRVKPPCQHYLQDQCGGCQLMHLSEAAQDQARSAIAGDALRRIGKFAVDDPVILPADRSLMYRTRMTLHYRNGRLGYFGGDHVFQLKKCLLVTPAIEQLHSALAPYQGMLPPETNKVVFRSAPDGGVHLVVITSRNACWDNAERLKDKIQTDVTIWWQQKGSDPRWVAGPLRDWPVTAFDQVNPVMAEQVRSHALRQLKALAGELIWDLYAGMGETTRQLAVMGARVESVELDPAAVALAEKIGPDGPLRLIGDAALLSRQLHPPAGVILNPPRDGVDLQVTRAICHSGAIRVVYISCDMATLARDLRRLSDRYRLTDVTAFDQFPQTAHVEAVAVMELV